MKRGNTYTILVTVAGVDLTTATDVVLTVKAFGVPPFIFSSDDMSISADTGGTTIAFKLSEEQSLNLRDYYDIDVNWMLSGNRGGTRIARVFVDKTLLNRALGGSSDTPDPDATEPDPINLTSEEVRVLNAISPKIVSTTHSGTNTVIVINDIQGDHTINIPDGQQGIQGPAGADGKDGQDGAPGADGKDGTDGQDGADGYSPTATVTKSGDTATITITDKNGTTTATVSDGKDGQDGAPGQDGQNGTDGTDGTDAYVYIRYSAAEPTSDSDMKTTPDAWIGIYSGDASSAPTHYTDYVWYKIKGETGAAGVVQDVQVNGISVLNQGVANVPLMSADGFGVAKIYEANGITISDVGNLRTNAASSGQIKSASQSYRPIVPSTQHESAFYGMAKAAGDTTQSQSSNAVGTYTEAAKSAIHDMLSAPVSVSGTTPTITAKAGIRYVCGEVATLDFTPSATGICDVVFTSGSTPTVLTQPTGTDAIIWADGWDGTCEADTVYELNVMDGKYGVKAAWT